MRVYALAIGLIFAALSATGRARAQTTPPSDTASSTALPLELELGNSKLDAETVRKAIELELKRPVVLSATAVGAASLTVTAHANQTVTVSYRTNTGMTRARSIGVPADGARGAEVIALLAGNLSRDEAAELLAGLVARGTPPTEPAPAAGEAPAPATEESASEPAAPTASTAATRPPPSATRAGPSAPPPLLDTPFPAINLSLVAPVTLYQSSKKRIFAGELGLFYSHVGELHGVGLNLFVLHTESDVRGMSYATLYNYTGGAVRGLTLSAIANRRHQLRGVELSGMLNLGSGDAQGFAAAGLANLNLRHRFEGAQAAGLINWAGGFEGLQAAGLVSWSDDFQGLQASGVFNRASRVTGVQAAGVTNVADSISGLQLGVVNVAGDVHGLQLGVVNVAKHVDGTSIGLVSVADNGRVQPVLWASSSLPFNVAAKFTVGPLYTQAGLGYAPGNHTYTYELGLGGHLPIGRFFLEPGVHYSEMRSSIHPFDHELIEYGHYRIAAGLDLRQVSPFAGLGLLHRFAHSTDAPASVPMTVEVFGGAAFF